MSLPKAKFLVVVTVGGSTNSAPILEICSILAARGHTIDFATLSGREKLVDNYPFVQKVHIVGPAISAEEDEKHYILFSRWNWNTAQGKRDIVKGKMAFDAFWPFTYRGLKEVITTTNPNFIFSDFHVEAALDVWNEWRLPHAVMWPQMPWLVMPPRAPRPWSNFNNNVVFTPPPSWVDPRTLYARTLQMSDNSLLITCEIYSPEDPLSLPIFRSTDGGATWKEHSRFRDQVNGWGMSYQPILYSLPERFGGYAVGTILALGTSLPSNKSHAYIDMYASTDGAKTFTFLSHIAYGLGPETVRNGDKAIWEAFLLMYKGTLIVYYSDQRDPHHGQKLVHTTTTDLRNWSPIVSDVSMNYYDGPPGMTTVAHIPINDNYIMTFENCGAPVKNCQVNYIVSNDPTNGDESLRLTLYHLGPLKASSKDGTLIANGNTDSSVYINDHRAFPENWKRVDINQKNGYSRDLRFIKDNRSNLKLLVASGGNYGEANTNALIVGVVNIPQ